MFQPLVPLLYLFFFLFLRFSISFVLFNIFFLYFYLFWSFPLNPYFFLILSFSSSSSSLSHTLCSSLSLSIDLLAIFVSYLSQFLDPLHSDRISGLLLRIRQMHLNWCTVYNTPQFTVKIKCTHINCIWWVGSNGREQNIHLDYKSSRSATSATHSDPVRNKSFKLVYVQSIQMCIHASQEESVRDREKNNVAYTISHTTHRPNVLCEYVQLRVCVCVCMRCV